LPLSAKYLVGFIIPTCDKTHHIPDLSSSIYDQVVWPGAKQGSRSVLSGIARDHCSPKASPTARHL